MLPAQFRMTRSTEFAVTIKRGVRTVRSDIVVYVRKDDTDGPGPQVGLIVAKSVGNAVVRHRVSRRLRHVAAGVLDQLDPSDRVVIRALPGSRDAVFSELEHQLRSGLRRSRRARESAQ